MIRRSLLAVVVVAIGLVTPSAAQPPSELLEKGIYTQDTVGDVDRALAIFRQVLKAPVRQRRYVAQAQARIVRCLVQKGDSAAAAHEFDRLVRDYASMLDEVLAKLEPDNHHIAVGLAAIPEKIRGFGHVKMRHLKAAKADETALFFKRRK